MKLDHEDPRLRFAQLHYHRRSLDYSIHRVFRDFHANLRDQAAFDFVYSLQQLPHAFMNTKLVSSIDSFVSTNWSLETRVKKLRENEFEKCDKKVNFADRSSIFIKNLSEGLRLAEKKSES